MIISSIYFLISSLLLPTAAVPSPPDALSFGEAVELALARNPQIEVARNTAAIAENNAHIGNAGLLPRIDLQGSLITRHTDAIDETSTTTTATLSAGYTLFDGFGNIYRFRKLQGLEKQGEIEARQQIEDTLYTVGRAYYTAASAAENLRIANDLLEISRERLERAEKKAEFGQAMTVDVLSAKVDYNNDRVTMAQAELVWEEARRSLNVLLQREIDTEFTIDPEVRFTEMAELAALQEAARSRNSSYLSVKEDVEQAGLDVKIARAAYFPSLDLSASYGDDSSWQVGAVLNFNLFNGFQKKIDSANAGLRMQNQRLLEQQAALDLEREVADAYRSYRYSLTVLELERENLKSAETNFVRTRELFQLGQVTTTQFREAQLNLIRSKSNIANDNFTAKLQEINLQRLTGQLLN